MVAGSCKYGDEPAGSCATELVSLNIRHLILCCPLKNDTQTVKYLKRLLKLAYVLEI
jgi:hypothetical protein